MAKKKSHIVEQEAHTTMLDALASIYPEGDREYMKFQFAMKLSEHFGERWKDRERCVNCGALMRQYTFTPTKLACNALRKLAAQVEENMARGMPFTEANRIHVPSTKSLTHNEADAGTILRYLGLIAKYKKNSKHVSGMWVITSWGWQFLRGGRVSAEVTTWRKQIISRSENTVTMRDVYQGEAGDYDELHYTYSIHEGEIV